jgi:monoamine oxidase
MSRTSERLPVTIIGAGIAGLTAAYHLTKGGRAVRVLEARNRVGGRMLSVAETGCALPVELGAEFVHGAAEPVMGLADALDTPMERVRDEHSFYEAGHFHSAKNPWKKLARVFEGAADEPDASVAQFLKRKGASQSDVALVRLMVEGFDAAPLDDVSTKSIAAEVAELSEDSDQFRPKGGYDRLVRGLIARMQPSPAVELRTNAVVESVDWQSGGACTVHSREEGKLNAHRGEHCVVAVPLGVLESAAEALTIRFSPELGSIERAVEHLAMGHVVKLVLVLRESEWMKGLPGSDFMHFPEGAFPTLWQQSSGQVRLITAWAGATKAKELELFDTRDLVDQAFAQLAACCKVAPVEIRDTLIAAHHHDFSRDPFSRGAYPYARPGGANCYTALAEPIGNTLFLAGDATDVEYFGTVAGAIASGARAARHILEL